jgi:hypothetical protein
MVDGWLRGAGNGRGGRVSSGREGSPELENMAAVGEGKRVAIMGARAWQGGGRR